MVAHEFRSSVTNIGASAEILEERCPEAVHQPEFAKIHRGLKRLHALIESCAFEDRLHCPPRLRPAAAIDVGRLLRDVVADTVPPAREADIRLSLDSHHLPLNADPTLIGVALSNLIDNAVKYSPPGTAIEISAVTEGRALTITVADHGPGIPEEQRTLIFEKYYRPQTDASVRGSGLGLHIVRQIADLHGGEVSVAAAADGGAIFSLKLPPPKSARGVG